MVKSISGVGVKLDTNFGVQVVGGAVEMLMAGGRKEERGVPISTAISVMVTAW